MPSSRRGRSPKKVKELVDPTTHVEGMLTQEFEEEVKEQNITQNTINETTVNETTVIHGQSWQERHRKPANIRDHVRRQSSFDRFKQRRTSTKAKVKAIRDRAQTDAAHREKDVAWDQVQALQKILKDLKTKNKKEVRGLRRTASGLQEDLNRSVTNLEETRAIEEKMRHEAYIQHERDSNEVREANERALKAHLLEVEELNKKLKEEQEKADAAIAANAEEERHLLAAAIAARDAAVKHAQEEAMKLLKSAEEEAAKLQKEAQEEAERLAREAQLAMDALEKEMEEEEAYELARDAKAAEARLAKRAKARAAKMAKVQNSGL